jgi:hypothetical protein
MTAELVVALISAAVALLSVALSVWSARSTARLQDELEQRRQQASKEELVEQVMSRYREPLLRAAFDLQSRIYNIVRQQFLARYLQQGGQDDQRYACQNTMFVFAEYLGWVEILRRGVQFLDLGDVRRNRLLVERLEAIGTILSTDRDFQDAVPCIFRGEQRAIGELMMDPTQAGEGAAVRQCIGYAAFTTRLEQEEDFARWFASLERDIRRLAASPTPDHRRLVALQHALLDLIDFLDDPPARFPQEQRARL